MRVITKRSLMQLLLVLLSFTGLLDAIYLTVEHYSGVIPPCGTGFSAIDCGRVLSSSYSVLFGVPLALFGVFQYAAEGILSAFSLMTKRTWAYGLLYGLTLVGAIFSLYFVYLMVGVLHAVCLYCLASAVISFLLFGLLWVAYPDAPQWCAVTVFGFVYRVFLKPLFFLIDPEVIHTMMVSCGQFLSRTPGYKPLVSFFFRIQNPMLSQKIHGIRFTLPVGLAAGFDYEAKLTQSLAPIGFGFQSVGTITNKPYEGNPRPMLGRLPKSRSLLVNKGFKNPGVQNVCASLSHMVFPIPVGISVGRSNSKTTSLTFLQSITDITTAFRRLENAPLHHAYYELNISCPNLFGTVSFYEPKRLERLLSAVDRLHLTRPVFVKLPIDRSLSDTKAMLTVIARHSAAGVIIGNLQTNRSHPSLDTSEVARFPRGNFSGKPTFDASNERISLCYAMFGSRLTIIGCGGIFSAADAYEKIKRGASLVQLITGMIYEGPSLIAHINLELSRLLEKDGYANISEAVGSAVRRRRTRHGRRG